MILGFAHLTYSVCRKLFESNEPLLSGQSFSVDYPAQFRALTRIAHRRQRLRVVGKYQNVELVSFDANSTVCTQCQVSLAEIKDLSEGLTPPRISLWQPKEGPQLFELFGSKALHSEFYLRGLFGRPGLHVFVHEEPVPRSTWNPLDSHGLVSAAFYVSSKAFEHYARFGNVPDIPLAVGSNSFKVAMIRMPGVNIEILSKLD